MNSSIPTENHFENYSVEFLSKLSKKACRMVFQMGYNWSDNTQMTIFPASDDPEKIAFTMRLFKKSRWMVVDIALLTKARKKLEYRGFPGDILESSNQSKLRSEAVILKSHLDFAEMHNFSEFYRRPIFTVRVNP